MTTVEASTVVQISAESAWDFLFDDPRRAAEHLDEILAIEDYEVRADGTPRYRMVRRFGPLPPMSFVSDYYVFERPHRAVNRVLESPLGGDFTVTYEPVPGGTRVRWRWEIESRSKVLGLLLPLLRPVLTRSLQRDVTRYAGAAVSAQDQQR